MSAPEAPVSGQATVQAAVDYVSKLPPDYMAAKLLLVVPVLQEARDALTAISELARKAHGISPTLADRMDAAGTFSLEDWRALNTGATP